MKQFTENTLKNSQYVDAIKYFVTNFDLESAFPHCKIVKYANLDKYQHIYDLLPNRIDFCFILTESKYNQGHWTALIRNDNKFEYFDSYSDSPKSILDFIPNYMNKQLGNNWSEDLGKIIKSIKKKYTYIWSLWQNLNILLFAYLFKINKIKFWSMEKYKLLKPTPILRS